MHFKSYFDDDESKIHLIFQPVFKCFQIFSSFIDKTFGWKSNELLEEGITTSAISGNTPKLTYIHNFKIAVKLEGNCLKQEKESFTNINVVKVFMN